MGRADLQIKSVTSGRSMNFKKKRGDKKTSFSFCHKTVDNCTPRELNLLEDVHVPVARIMISSSGTAIYHELSWVI
jgi:hypothetical protein